MYFGISVTFTLKLSKAANNALLEKHLIFEAWPFASRKLWLWSRSGCDQFEMYGLEDPLDSPDFDPIAFINQNFPTGDQMMAS